jgi:RNA polymerase sigma-70 factor (ECF subfamily)
MLGSRDDAEEALQEALLRAWRGLPAFQGRSSIRAWLYRIATNACHDTIAHGRRRRPPVIPVDYGAPADPHDEWAPPGEWPASGDSIEDGYLVREEARRASLVAFTSLSPIQRAALVLRVALGFSAAETAKLLDTSPAAVNSALQRARRALDAGSATPARTDARLREAAGRCLDAMEAGDVGAVLASLTSA